VAEHFMSLLARKSYVSYFILAEIIIFLIKKYAKKKIILKYANLQKI